MRNVLTHYLLLLAQVLYNKGCSVFNFHPLAQLQTHYFQANMIAKYIFIIYSHVMIISQYFLYLYCITIYCLGTKAVFALIILKLSIYFWFKSKNTHLSTVMLKVQTIKKKSSKWVVARFVLEGIISPSPLATTF